MMEPIHKNKLEQYLQKEILQVEKYLKLPKEILSFILGGKRIRATIILSPGSKNEKLSQNQAARIIELTHASSLIHDDIIDESYLRRGKPTAFGKLSAANASSIGYYIFSRLFLTIIRLQPFFYHHYFRILSEMCIGQILEIESTKSNKVSIKSYLKTIRLKTGALFAFCFGIKSSGWEEEDAKIGYHFGTGFQILDDLYDVTLEESNTGKPNGQDAKQGIITLPFLYGSLSKAKNKAQNIISEVNLEKLPLEWKCQFIELSNKINQVS